MKYKCDTCGSYLKQVKRETRKVISYKVLNVTTETKFKCPKGCVLTLVNQVKEQYS